MRSVLQGGRLLRPAIGVSLHGNRWRGFASGPPPLTTLTDEERMMKETGAYACFTCVCVYGCLCVYASVYVWVGYLCIYTYGSALMAASHNLPSQPTPFNLPCSFPLSLPLFSLTSG